MDPSNPLNTETRSRFPFFSLASPSRPDGVLKSEMGSFLFRGAERQVNDLLAFFRHMISLYVRLNFTPESSFPYYAIYL